MIEENKILSVQEHSWFTWKKLLEIRGEAGLKSHPTKCRCCEKPFRDSDKLFLIQVEGEVNGLVCESCQDYLRFVLSKRSNSL